MVAPVVAFAIVAVGVLCSTESAAADSQPTLKCTKAGMRKGFLKKVSERTCVFSDTACTKANDVMCKQVRDLAEKATPKLTYTACSKACYTVKSAQSATKASAKATTKKPTTTRKPKTVEEVIATYPKQMTAKQKNQKMKLVFSEYTDSDACQKLKGTRASLPWLCGVGCVGAWQASACLHTTQ